ncbi:MAG TPA: prolyl oligopeptidase family serine peptidase, partial [Phycisphaerales bacterium]|nr:prolyl oligopeptidase family serine peptidase [Phycisphaerales bacterium]
FLSWTSPAGAHRYALYVPPAEIARPPYALVVFLHGRGESGSDGVKQTSVGLIPAVLNNPERWPCIILAPQKPEFNPLWPTEESVVMAEIEMIRSQFPIDENRIALTGLSQGGNGTWMFAAAHPDLWSALAPVCGFSRDLPPAQIAQKTRHIPTWAFHGLKDNVVPPEQTKAIIDALRASGPTAEIKYTEFPEANHNSWDAAYRGDGLASWLLSQTRGNRSTSEPNPPSTTNTR